MTLRLLSKPVRQTGDRVAIRFDGREIPALEGESVAAALTAAGIRTLRRTRSGAPRGLWCGIGTCFECLVTIDGRPEQRACLAKVVSGRDVRSAPPRDAKPLAPDPSDAPMRRNVDVLVVGARPAGLNAARIAARAWLECVDLGGSRPKFIPITEILPLAMPRSAVKRSDAVANVPPRITVSNSAIQPPQSP